tara:strand:- start:505 stop:1398 length:894 start_codon:yes stop_codon:yes gene_type:complete
MEVLFAILSATVFGLVSAIDKRLIAKSVPNFNCFCCAVAISLTIFAIGTFLLFDIGMFLNQHRIIAVISGCCWGGTLGIQFYGYKIEEASRVSAIVHTFPVFVAILAIPLLGESLSTLQFLAMGVVVLGAYAISINDFSLRTFFKINKALPILILASFLMALAHLTGKYSLASESVESVYVYRNLGMAFVLFTFCKPRTPIELFKSMNNKLTIWLLLVSEFILAPVAVILQVLATNMGAITIISTVTASRPVFVFAFVTLFSLPFVRLLDEKLDAKTLAVKSSSIAAITVGIAVLSI